MEQLIGLTTYSRRGKVLATAALQVFDIAALASPITIVGGKATFNYASKLQSGRSRDLVEYKVNEALAAIVQLSKRLVLLTVTKRNGTTKASVATVFNIEKMCEPIESQSTGSKFLYIEEQDQDPVEYVVTESPAAILTQANTDTRQSTGTAVEFTFDRAYGTVAAPESGNITASLTNAVPYRVIMIVHNAGVEPTYPATFKKNSLSGNYVNSVINYIYVIYLSSTVQSYSISQTA